MIGKAGDRVIYIGYAPDKIVYDELILDSNYTIKYVNHHHGYDLYVLVGFETCVPFMSDEFETLSEYRKRKLKKLNNLK